MRSIFQDIQAELQRFIDSRAENILIIPCEPMHSALLLKSLEAVEDEPESADIFLTFGHKFADPEQFVREIPPIISRQLASLNQELTERGKPILPSPPAELTNESQKPPVRLLGLMRYVESLVAAERLVIWVFYPMEIGAPTLYAQFVNHVNDELKTGSLPMTKSIFRDSEDSPVLAPWLDDQPNVRVYRPELNPESFEKKLNEKANDLALPAEERAQIHMMLAGFDVANQRYDTAFARNLELLGYFRHVGQQQEQAIVMNNIGDLHYIQKKFSEAQTWYERAINLSVSLKSEPLVMDQSFNLGNALLAQNKFTDALLYYDATERLAGASKQPLQRIQALEQMGTANYRMGKSAEAAENWEKAVELCRETKFKEGQKANLERLRDLYQELGDSPRLAACKSALSELMS
ncbi:MAG: tetratricopeptide repeat protein [Blastocatellia bacterium]|nr:tetratricopeptide repeat protein [Blastocatellia bacterium]